MEEVLVQDAHTSLDYESWYHSTRHSNHFNEAYYNARAKIALDKFFSGIDRNTRILDFGCGLGQNIYYMPNAVGYDISKFGIEFCRKKGINATTQLEDIADESFDVVFSAHVLEHRPHPMTMQEEVIQDEKTIYDLVQERFKLNTITLEAFAVSSKKYSDALVRRVSLVRDVNVSKYQLESLIGMPLEQALESIRTKQGQ